MDFYNARTLLGLSDEQIVRRVRNDYLGACVPGFRLLQVVDSSVLKFRGAVTAFSPGSNASLPTTSSSVPGVYFAGDWVRQGPSAPYDQRGLSQEKALVTGSLTLFCPTGVRRGVLLESSRATPHWVVQTVSAAPLGD